MLKNLLAVAICLLFVGCATVGTRIKQDDVSKIKDGVTSKQEIVSIFGKPMNVISSSEGMTFMYQFIKTTPGASNFIPIVGMLHSEYSSDQQILTIYFDEKDIVKKHSMSDSSMPVSAGLLH